MSKIISAIFLLLLLSGCIQNSAFFGSVITVASTGSIAQGGLSYGSNYAIKNITGKTPMENVTEILSSKKNDNEVASKLKKKMRKAGNIKDLSNQ
jgi:hypothetical protein|tara:strand:+ start:606 stop:890 length:285 start_codon:yes stop_codon:yes gene_type:complete